MWTANLQQWSKEYKMEQESLFNKSSWEICPKSNVKNIVKNNELSSCLTPITKISSKWIKGLESINYIENNIVRALHAIGFRV